MTVNDEELVDRQRGLYGKYRVERTDGRSEPGAKHADCFYYVLDLVHDPHAIPALRAYAESARADGYESLADDLDRITGDRDLLPPLPYEWDGMR